MKTVKLIFIFSFLALAFVSILWVLGLIGSDIALDTLKRSWAVFGILGFTSLMIFVVLKPSGEKSQKPTDNAGPQF